MRFFKLLTVGFLAMAVAYGCQKADEGKAAPKPVPAEKGKDSAKKAEAGHEAHHGGCLNAIELCAVGHAEVKVEGDTLRCWLVGGENETGKSVRVPDTEIRLAVNLESGAEKTLVLEAKPIDVADEKVGDCSYFEGAADWLKSAGRFQALGTVHFKGKERKIEIRYPDGFDPDDDAPAGDKPDKK
jgi:hypothetical protein